VSQPGLLFCVERIASGARAFFLEVCKKLQRVALNLSRILLSTKEFQFMPGRWYFLRTDEPHVPLAAQSCAIVVDPTVANHPGGWFMLRIPRTLAIGLLLICCLGGISHTAWAQFEMRGRRDLLSVGYAIATGDFNADGKLDVAVIDNGFSVLLGNGDGTLQKAVHYSYPELGLSIAAADFNGDGKLDLVTPRGDHAVSVFLGKGDGTFQPPISSSTTGIAYTVAVGDFKDDHKMDIVVIGNPNISVLLGNGNGTFQSPEDNNSFVGPHEITVGDFNNDHRLDVMVTGFFGGSQYAGVLLGNGDGTL
jgi:hypothetical protein